LIVSRIKLGFGYGFVEIAPATAPMGRVILETMAFTELLASSWFKYGLLPCITTGVALLIKFNSRPDARRPARDDWAVGFDLCQVSVFAILADGVADAVKSVAHREASPRVSERLAELPWILVGMLLVLILVSFVVRKTGWAMPGGAHGSQPELNLWGVILPLVIGFGYIIGTIVWMGGISD